MSNGELQLTDSSNHWLVCIVPDVKPPYTERILFREFKAVASRTEALNLAAWIVALVDAEGRDFNRLLEAIKNS